MEHSRRQTELFNRFIRKEMRRESHEEGSSCSMTATNEYYVYSKHVCVGFVILWAFPSESKAQTFNLLIYYHIKTDKKHRYHFTYNLSSRQILGPTTLAAPLAILKAKCPGGHDLDKPHLLYLAGFVAVNTKLAFTHRNGQQHFRANTSCESKRMKPLNKTNRLNCVQRLYCLDAQLRVKSWPSLFDRFMIACLCQPAQRD